MSFHSCEGNPLINGNPKIAYFSTNISESESFAHGYTWLAVIVKDGFHFIHGSPLINGTAKVVYYSTHFSESDTFYRRTLG